MTCARGWCRVSVVAVALACPPLVQADAGLDAARRLYAAAAYEEALKALEGLDPATPDAPGAVAIQQQRVLCLVALGRPADAEQAMTSIVQADPLYLPDAATAPPRVRAAFRDVRARLVPAIAKSEYERARGAFEAADYATASAGFARVISMVALSDGAGADAVLSDLAVVAAGFKTLSDKANAPAPAAPVPPESAPVTAAPSPPRLYDATYPDLAVPKTVRQEVPQWPRHLGSVPNRDAVLEIIINDEGRVEAARLIRRVHRAYDQLLLAAASTWSYTPAQLDGSRVKFRKVMKLSFK
jgi:TonB family protein